MTQTLNCAPKNWGIWVNLQGRGKGQINAKCKHENDNNNSSNSLKGFK